MNLVGDEVLGSRGREYGSLGAMLQKVTNLTTTSASMATGGASKLSSAGNSSPAANMGTSPGSGSNSNSGGSSSSTKGGYDSYVKDRIYGKPDKKQ